MSAPAPAPAPEPSPATRRCRTEEPPPTCIRFQPTSVTEDPALWNSTHQCRACRRHYERTYRAEHEADVKKRSSEYYAASRKSTLVKRRAANNDRKQELTDTLVDFIERNPHINELFKQIDGVLLIETPKSERLKANRRNAKPASTQSSKVPA